MFKVIEKTLSDDSKTYDAVGKGTDAGLKFYAVDEDQAHTLATLLEQVSGWDFDKERTIPQRS